MNWYHCSNCNVITQRDSEKKRIKSTCEANGAKSTLAKVENANKLAKKLRKQFLKNIIDLKSFTPKERMFLYMAFEQGSMVTFNGITAHLIAKSELILKNTTM